MLEAFLHNVTGPVTVLAESTASYTVPDRFSDVVFVGSDGLLTGHGTAHRIALDSVKSLLANADSFSVVGADTIDGGYHRSAAATSWAIASFAAEQGVDTRILGFSWRPDVEVAIKRFARVALENGVRALVRDPVSYSRFQQDVNGGELVADTVFTLPSVVRADENISVPTAVLNLSGLVDSRSDLTRSYTMLVEGLVDRGMRVIVVPHVASAHSSDNIPMRKLAASLAGRHMSQVEFMDRLPAPRESVERAAGAAVTITGRMHLAILGLLGGCPPVVLGTQGKVSGLMSSIGHADWEISPGPGMHEQILHVVDEILADHKAVVHEVQGHVTSLAHLAAVNFDGLEMSGAPDA
ncbi:MAG: polysaccharide pyruvyl transferase family protein [Demequina sp.]|nr:polysaccharide pyruvyl transferase family protein [Demequina sp.]